MNQSKQDTKAKILAAALDMFSVNGYSTVSIRDIGSVVGIKESSIYYHFRNKEEILQTLLMQAERLTEERKSGFTHALSASTEIGEESFIAAGIAYVEQYLLESGMFKLIRMLTMEKQRNTEAAAVYHKLLFSAPLEHQSKVFAYMLERGFIKHDEPEALAAEYQALILFVFQKYFAGNGPIEAAAKTAARNELELLLGRFYNGMIREGEGKP